MIKSTKYLLSLFIFALMPVITSCGDDNDEPQPDADAITIPEDAVYLNMMNESNGKSLLGNTDVYLSDSKNFVSPAESFISNPDKDRFLDTFHSVDQIFSQMAVTPDNIYQIFPRENIHRFPSGTNALKSASPYINAYIESWIKKGGKIIGAKVAFIESIEFEKIETPSERTIYSSPIPNETAINNINYDSSHELDISAPADKNISIQQISRDYIRITTTGPVTADITVYIRHWNKTYSIQTIHITPGTE